MQNKCAGTKKPSPIKERATGKKGGEALFYLPRFCAPLCQEATPSIAPIISHASLGTTGEGIFINGNTK